MFTENFRADLEIFKESLQTLADNTVNKEDKALISRTIGWLDTFLNDMEKSGNHDLGTIKKRFNQLTTLGQSEDKTPPPNNPTMYAMLDLLNKNVLSKHKTITDCLDTKKLSTGTKTVIKAARKKIDKAYATSVGTLNLHLQLYSQLDKMADMREQEQAFLAQLGQLDNTVSEHIRNNSLDQLKGLYEKNKMQLLASLKSLPYLVINIAAIEPSTLVPPLRPVTARQISTLISIEKDLVEKTKELPADQRVNPEDCVFTKYARDQGVGLAAYQEQLDKIYDLTEKLIEKWKPYAMGGSGSSAWFKTDTDKKEAVGNMIGKLETIQSGFQNDKFKYPYETVQELLDATVNTLFKIFEVSMEKGISPGNSAKDLVANAQEIMAFMTNNQHLYNPVLCELVDADARAFFEQRSWTPQQARPK